MKCPLCTKEKDYEEESLCCDDCSTKIIKAAKDVSPSTDTDEVSPLINDLRELYNQIKNSGESVDDQMIELLKLRVEMITLIW